MTTLDSVIAAHWANLIPAPTSVDLPMHEAMDDYIAGQREPTSHPSSPTRPSPTAGTGGTP